MVVAKVSITQGIPRCLIFPIINCTYPRTCQYNVAATYKIQMDIDFIGPIRVKCFADIDLTSKVSVSSGYKNI